jgi:hypothetical protein
LSSELLDDRVVQEVREADGVSGGAEVTAVGKANSGYQHVPRDLEQHVVEVRPSKAESRKVF